MRPFLFQDGNQHKVQFIDQGPLLMQTLFRGWALNDEPHNEIPYPCLKLENL